MSSASDLLMPTRSSMRSCPSPRRRFLRVDPLVFSDDWVEFEVDEFSSKTKNVSLLPSAADLTVSGVLSVQDPREWRRDKPPFSFSVSGALSLTSLSVNLPLEVPLLTVAGHVVFSLSFLKANEVENVGVSAVLDVLPLQTEEKLVRKEEEGESDRLTSSRLGGDSIT